MGIINVFTIICLGLFSGFLYVQQEHMKGFNEEGKNNIFSSFLRIYLVFSVIFELSFIAYYIYSNGVLTLLILIVSISIFVWFFKLLREKKGLTMEISLIGLILNPILACTLVLMGYL